MMTIMIMMMMTMFRPESPQRSQLKTFTMITKRRVDDDDDKDDDDDDGGNPSMDKFLRFDKTSIWVLKGFSGQHVCTFKSLKHQSNQLAL